jgi:simple sugar transport system ATP-binding protein
MTDSSAAPLGGRDATGTASRPTWAEPGTPPVLTLRGITKRFPGVVAADGIDLDVHAGEIVGLLGENGAGKTTLMNMVFGMVRPDAGEVIVDGRAAQIEGPRDALELGIGMVHQHFKLVARMTVAENLALGRGGPTALHLGRVRERIEQLSTRFRLGVGPDDAVAELSVGQQQRVEILKLLLRDVRLLILDEPTAVLTPQEWEQLAEILRELAAAGRAVVFITHKLDELLDVTDRVVVLRDGANVGQIATADADRETLARMMVGRDVVLRVERARVEPGPVALELRDVTVGGTSRPALDGVSLQVRRGEVLGIAGVDGNGQRELVELLCRLRRPDDGAVLVDGRDLLDDPSADEAVSVIPEDRHRTATALQLPVLENLLMRDLGRAPWFRRGMVRRRAVQRHALELLAEYDVRVPGPGVAMRQLSGGNQQKVVLARELQRRPQVIVASQPTRGLDVGAMEFVYRCLQDHKRRGAAILLVSSELNEVLSLSDRIAVLAGGRLSEPQGADDVDVRGLGLLMAAS